MTTQPIEGLWHLHPLLKTMRPAYVFGVVTGALLAGGSRRGFANAGPLLPGPALLAAGLSQRKLGQREFGRQELGRHRHRTTTIG